MRAAYHSVGSGGEGQRDPRAPCGALWNQIFVFLEGAARLLGPPLAVRHVAGTRPRLTLSLEQVHVDRIGLCSGGTVATPATTTGKRPLHARKTVFQRRIRAGTKGIATALAVHTVLRL